MRKAAALIFLFSPLCHAGPPPGTYELYNGEGIKTGNIVSSSEIDNSAKPAITLVKTTTKLEFPGATGTYRFVETETVEIDGSGVRKFRRESDDNGKKNLYLGERRSGLLVVNYEINGAKFSTSFSTSSFDLTELDMDQPGSKFRVLKPGQSKTLRVLFLDRMDIVPVSRNVAEAREFSYNNEAVSVLIVTTLIKGKPSTAWFKAADGLLLQEEGTDYLMSRVVE